jgi:hypothetical protein
LPQGVEHVCAQEDVPASPVKRAQEVLLPFHFDLKNMNFNKNSMLRLQVPAKFSFLPFSSSICSSRPDFICQSKRFFHS